MNTAYELADKLEKSKAWLDSLNTQYKNGFGKYCLLPNDVANMLRQQADRIAELEKEAEDWEKATKWMEMTRQVPEKQSEPVAWLIKTDQENGGDVVFPEELNEITKFYKDENWEYTLIPLYTTPQTKPLSDEEIISLAELSGFKWSQDKGIHVKHSNGSWIGIDVNIVDLCRAIEAKVRGEK
jgi:hypothetical protein